MAVVMIISGLALFAQTNIDENAAFPVEDGVIIGKLENGMTYYIRHNEKPKDRAQFWLVVNAGAIQEDADQNGLAHFTEHMAFNGTKNFESKDIINYLQSIGMKFGPEINAYTSHDVTNYMLQKVPIDTKENIDTSLMILYDWATNISFVGQEIESERGVIHEEWRSGMSAQRRVRNKYFSVLFEGSKYATHDVIGQMEIVDNFEHDVIKRFYQDWYRPDLQAVIAVGDFDVKEMEKKIIEKFSSIPKRENVRERTIEQVPAHEETKVAIVTDKEERAMNVQIYYKHAANTDKSKQSYYKKSLMEQLYNSMINARMGELAQSATPPFVRGYSYITNYVRSTDVYISGAMAAGANILDPLQTLVLENKRVLEFGFTESEFERAKKEILASYEKAYNERESRMSSSFAQEFLGHYLENDPIPGIEFEYDLVKAFLPQIKVEEVNALAGKWMTDKNRVIVITAPEAAASMLPTKEQVIEAFEKASKEEVTAYTDNVSDQPLFGYNVIPTGIKEEKTCTETGITKLILNNGATVILKPTKFKQNEILFTAFSKGGLSQYEDKDYVTADFASTIIDMSGIDNFDNVQLQKMLADKVVRINPYISDLYEGFSGATTSQDVETLFQLLNLYFTHPRSDEGSYKSFVTRQEAYLINRANDPMTAFRDSLTNIVYESHHRKRPLTTELMKEADYNKMLDIFKQRFSNAADFTFIFVGDFEMEGMKKLLTDYISSLESSENTENFVDRKMNVVEGQIIKTIYRDMLTPKATIYITMGGEFDYSRKERMLLTFIKEVLDVRYTETVREEQSGTYGVGVWTTMQQYPEGYYALNVSFTCAPEKAEMLTAIIYEQIELLKKEGPTAQEIANIVENKVKERKEFVEQNRFWLSGLQFEAQSGMSTLDTDEYFEILNSITAKDIKKATKKFFKGENLIQLTMLPAPTN